jgi:hypothetical protein
VNEFIHHLLTPLGTTLYWPHWHTQTNVFSLLQSPLTVSWQRLLPREILQLPALRSSWHSRPCRALFNWQLNYPGPRLAAISHQPSSLLFTGWLSTDNWRLNSLTYQPATSRHFTQLNCWQLTAFRVRVTLRLEVYRLGAEPLETHGQNHFLNWTPAVIVLI